MSFVSVLLTVLLNSTTPSNSATLLNSTTLSNSAAVLAEDGRLAAAEAFFERYQELLQAFDPEVIDQYSDDARIVNVRRYPGDLPDRTLELTGAQYKDLARGAMPMAKERGDVSRYSELTYSLEGERVRIRATRYSVLKDYESPYSALVGPSEKGSWLIFEEHSESQP